MTPRPINPTAEIAESAGLPDTDNVLGLTVIVYWRRK